MTSEKSADNTVVLPEQTPSGQKILYKQQYRTCGKKRCQVCRKGLGHGPYWYAYWHQGKKPYSCYIGKDLNPIPIRQRLQID